MFDAQTGSGSIRVPRVAFGVPPNASSRRQKPNTGIKALFQNALASWTAAAMTPLFPGATGRPAQSADLSAHSKYLSGHPVNKSALFCAICDLLPSPNATRVMGITCKFRIGKNAQNFSFKTSWRSTTCENPPQVNKGNCPQKNSDFFSGHFYRKTLANPQKITKKTPQNHAKKSRFLTHFSHGGLLANPQKIPQKTRPKNCKYCAKIKPTPHPANLCFLGKRFARVSVQTSDGLAGMGSATVPGRRVRRPRRTLRLSPPSPDPFVAAASAALGLSVPALPELLSVGRSIRGLKIKTPSQTAGKIGNLNQPESTVFSSKKFVFFCSPKHQPNREILQKTSKNCRNYTRTIMELLNTFPQRKLLIKSQNLFRDLPMQKTGKDAIFSSMQLKFLCALAAFFCAVLPACAFDSSDADAAFAAYNSAFYVAGNGFAYYKEDTSGGRSRFWVQAEQIEMIEDACDRTRSPAAREMIKQSIDGFIRARGTNWITNEYNDDILWMTIACARGYLITGNRVWRDAAQRNFDAVYARGYNDTLGGGLFWNTHEETKNACVNGPAAIAACLLCQIYHDPSYLAEAEAIYTWERCALFDPSTGAVSDNMDLSGRISRNTFTYNEGTFIGAADLLWKLTGDTNYLNDALLAADYTRKKIAHGKTLPAYGSGDAAGFNGIFVRWLARFVADDRLWPQFYPWLSLNADAAWRVRRADNLSWQKWNRPTPEGTLDSWNCSDTVVILQVVPAKLPSSIK